LKKSLIAFVVAFALSIILTFLPLFTRAELSMVFQSSIAESISYGTLISTFFSLVGLAVFFVVFYFLANRSKILAVKSTVVALLLGVILGSAILDLLLIVPYRTYLEVYLNFAVSSSVSGVFQFFLPALTALLLAELREKKANHNLTEEKKGLSST
jgi:uncharacterized membrane protein